MTVELFGMARALVGASSVELAVAEPSTVRALLTALATRYPQLAGTVLDRATSAPLEPNIILLDGRRAQGLDEPLVPGDRPCLMLLPSGG